MRVLAGVDFVRGRVFFFSSTTSEAEALEALGAETLEVSEAEAKEAPEALGAEALKASRASGA